MPSTFTANLGIEKPATGEQAGNWGVTANNSYDALDSGIDGSTIITLSSAAYSLVTNPGVPSLGRNKVIVFKGALPGNCAITIGPAGAQKIYFVTNLTTGGFALVFSQSSGGTPFTLLNGRSAIIYADGAATNPNVSGVISDLQVNSLLVQANLVINGQVQWSSPADFNQSVNFQGTATFQQAAVFNQGLTIDVAAGGDAIYDMYYRSATGPIARLPNGAAGQVLTAGSSGPQWLAPQVVGVGGIIAGSAPYQVFYADVGQHLSQDANLQWGPGVGLGLGMAPSYALSVGRGLPATIQLDAQTPAIRRLFFSTNSVARWQVGVNNDSETGSNLGSSFLLNAYNDAGGGALSVMSAFRKTGHVVFGFAADAFSSQVTIFNGSDPADNLLCLRAAAGQTGYLQVWQNSLGQTVASVDAAGNLISAGTATYLKLDSNHRLDINGTVTGHPVGTIHVGADVSAQLSPCIALEACPSVGGGLPIGAHVMRIFQRNNAFQIQFDVGGQIYYFICAFPGGAGAVTWTCATSPA